MGILNVLLIVTSLVAALNAEDECVGSEGMKGIWVDSPFGTSFGGSPRQCLWFSRDDKKDHAHAFFACIQKGGELVKLTNPMAVLDHTDGETMFWAGGNDIDVEGVWRWVDNTTFHTPEMPWYAWFAESKEPNNGFGNEDCLMVNYRVDRLKYYRKGYFDYGCQHELDYICELKM